MTEASIGSNVGGTLFALVTVSSPLLFAQIGGDEKVIEDGKRFLREEYQYCIGTGGLAAFVFLCGNLGDGARQLRTGQLLGQTGVTFVCTAATPLLYHTYWSANVGIGTYAAIGMVGSVLAYAIYNAGAVWAKAQGDNGTLLGTLVRFVPALFGRLTAASPEKPSAPSVPELHMKLKPGTTVTVDKAGKDGHTADKQDYSHTVTRTRTDTTTHTTGDVRPEQ